MVEAGVGERAVELAQGHEPGGGEVAEAGERLQPVGDLLELGDALTGQAEALLAVEIGADGVLAVLDVQLVGDDAPDLVLGGGVLRRGDIGSPGTYAAASAAMALRRAR